MNSIVEVDGLRKVYGTTVAVDGISFEVQQGEIFGLLGPNGAGKTTTIECIEGLRRPDAGCVQVLGLDPRKDAYALRERIGVQFQSATLPDRMKVWEALDLFASFYRRSVDWRPLLEQVGLTEKSGAYFSALSGGQKQRVYIALALINDPELVFLDELTTGLDPQSRRATWDLIQGIRERGKTVFLTTHFMEEAERLCDRVAIVDAGKIVALDTPGNLTAALGDENRVVFETEGSFPTGLLQALPGVARVEQIGERVVVCGQKEGLFAGVAGVLEHSGKSFTNLRSEQPTLEDVFLALTGRAMRS
ncbi:MAG TPA: ABC transporter ATP-binding protein [Anaerolineaceae bacterium]|jgi:ABC-2 type transport system ATP-binding protein|nr:ABC transporter ATP-binding protein [Anaerolineaceae bacterium]